MNTHDLTAFTESEIVNQRSLDFVRVIGCLYDATRHEQWPRATASDLDIKKALTLHAERYPRSLNRDTVLRGATWLTKAVVEPGTTTSPSWASPLASVKPLASAFLDIARPASLIGKLLANGARRVPFNVAIPIASTGGSYRWVGQGAPKPVGSMALSTISLPVYKSAGLLVLTEELLKLSAPASEIALRREMTNGMNLYLDQQLTDPTVAAVAGVSPASITNGASSIVSAGPTAANAATDVKKLLGEFTAVNPNVENLVLLMSPAVAVAVAVAANSQTLGPSGGHVFGAPVLTSTAIGSRIIAVDASALYIADDDGIDISISRNATIEMENPATSPATAATVMTSLWSSNLAGLRVDRYVNYKLGRNSSVLYVNVSYA